MFESRIGNLGFAKGVVAKRNRVSMRIPAPGQTIVQCSRRGGTCEGAAAI